MADVLMSHPTADWQPLYDVHYRKIEIAEMMWDNVGDLARFKIAGSPFGGPLALRKDEKKLLVDDGSSTRPSIKIFSGSGRTICNISWDSSSRVAGFGWTDSEKLVLVLQDGSVRVYNIHGDMINSFSLGEEVKRQRVLEVDIWGAGMVVLTKQYQFCSVDDIDDANPEMLANTGLDSPPTSWAVIQPQFTGHSGVEVLVGTPDGSILVVEADRCGDQQLSTGPFTKMSVSPTGKILATFTSTGQLWVVSTDFSQNLSEFNTKSKVPPTQLVWCGTDAVVLYWENPSLMLLVGPYGDWLKYNYDKKIHLVSEVDGVRIVTQHESEYLQRVPNVTEDIFKIASTSSASKLYDAMEHFHRKSPRADELIRIIKESGDLEHAVDACIEAASQEWNPILQRLLLKAASFGKCFLSGYDPTHFVKTCRELRVLNAIRDPRVGMPLSHLQYVVLSPAVLIDRLINRHHHFLAWKICQFLGMKGHRVLVQWACSKVKGVGDEQSIAQSITQKLQSVPGISYAEIASTAYKHGRPALATRLLDYEPRAADQVPLLISMHQEEVALQKAIECGDTDLIYLVLLHVRRAKRKHPKEFFDIMLGKPQAIELMIKYAWQQDTDLLKAIFQQTGTPERQGDLAVFKSFRVKDPESRARLLSAAHDVYNQSKNKYFEKEACGSQVKLLRYQMDLENSEQGETFLGLSVGQTLIKLCELGLDKKAAKIVKEFRVSDARYWWIRVRALVARRRWDQLQALASKKSPIGYTPFVDVCNAAGFPEQAMQYVKNIPEVHIQAGYYVQLGYYKEAADCAVILKDPNALQQILNKCKDADDRRYVQSMLAQFQ